MNCSSRFASSFVLGSLAALVLLGTVACGGEAKPAPAPSSPALPPAAAAPTEKPDPKADETPTAPPQVPSPDAASSAAPSGPIDPATVGSIRGVVRFAGTPPKRLPVQITAAGCGEHASPPLFETVIVENGKLANVFVTIRKGLEKVEVPPASDVPVELDQQGCLYVPHVRGMRTGQTLKIQNDDQVTHNVNLRESKNATFNQVQAAGSPDVEWKPLKRELGVEFACDLHPWMKAYVCVEEHPFWAITGSDGAFTLQGLPPGGYTLEAWHEKYGKQTLKVVVPKQGQAEAEFTFKP
jgi:plastocyanin